MSVFKSVLVATKQRVIKTQKEAAPRGKTMTWVNIIAITISLAVMARASNLFREGLMLPSPIPGTLQFVGVFAIVVATLGIVALSVS